MFLIEDVFPNMSDEEKMLKDFFAMLLGGKDDFRLARAIRINRTEQCGGLIRHTNRFMRLQQK